MRHLPALPCWGCSTHLLPGRAGTELHEAGQLLALGGEGNWRELVASKWATSHVWLTLGILCRHSGSDGRFSDFSREAKKSEFLFVPTQFLKCLTTDSKVFQIKGRPSEIFFCSCQQPVCVFGYKLFFPRNTSEEKVRRAVVSNQRWVAGRAVLRYKSSEHTFHWIQ